MVLQLERRAKGRGEQSLAHTVERLRGENALALRRHRVVHCICSHIRATQLDKVVHLGHGAVRDVAWHEAHKQMAAFAQLNDIELEVGPGQYFSI